MTLTSAYQKLFLYLFLTTNASLILGSELFDECSKNFQFRPNNIISAQKSLSLGAKFTNKISVSSFKECYFWCCNSSSCTSAFWESNFPSICFMFDCRPPARCIYVASNNYDSIIQDFPAKNSSVKHEERCDSSHVCTGNKTICSDGICVCQSGWIHKKDRCVPSVCQFPELQFQCDDASACVAIYDRCNGIPECPDGSDEFFCATDDFNPTSQFTNDTSRNDKFKYRTKFDLSDPESKFPYPSNRNHIAQIPSKHSLLSTQKPTSVSNFDGFVRRPSYSHISSRNYRGKYPLFRGINLEKMRYEHPKDSLFVELPAASDDTFVPDERWQYSKYQNYLDLPVINHKIKHSFHPSFSERSTFSDDSPSYVRFNPHKSNYHIRPYINDMHTLSSVSHPKDPDYFRPGEFYEDDSTGLSDLVDPSVYQSPSHPESYGNMDENPDRPYKHMKPYAHVQDHSENKINDIKDTKKENTQSEGAVTTPKSLTASKTSDELLSAIERSHSEGHTAALLLAFSLGLLCCFVGLLILEWRRRHKLHRWTARTSQPDSTIIFGGKPKFPMSRQRQHRKNWRELSTDPRRCTDEENRALCDSLVL